MHILSQFMGGQNDDTTDFDAEAEAEQIAKAKSERQKLFRNGPRKLTTTTSGQFRRAQTRAAKAQSRKANRRYRRDWMASQQRIANLRGQLQVATLGADRLPDALVINAQMGILNGFGDRDESGKLIRFDQAYDVALENASAIYATAKGA